MPLCYIPYLPSFLVHSLVYQTETLSNPILTPSSSTLLSNKYLTQMLQVDFPNSLSKAQGNHTSIHNQTKVKDGTVFEFQSSFHQAWWPPLTRILRPDGYQRNATISERQFHTLAACAKAGCVTCQPCDDAAEFIWSSNVAHRIQTRPLFEEVGLCVKIRSRHAQQCHYYQRHMHRVWKNAACTHDVYMCPGDSELTRILSGLSSQVILLAIWRTADLLML